MCWITSRRSASLTWPLYSGMESAYNGASRHLHLVPHDVPKHVIVHYYARESRYIYPFSLRRVGFIKRVL